MKGFLFGVFEMKKCITCADNLSSEDIGWCNRCAQFAPLLVGAGFEGRPTLKARQSINEVLSPNRQRTAHPRWRAILDKFDNGDNNVTVDNNRTVQTVASAGRSVGGNKGRKVKLTASQVAIAKRLNVPLEEYAKYV